MPNINWLTIKNNCCDDEGIARLAALMLFPYDKKSREALVERLLTTQQRIEVCRGEVKLSEPGSLSGSLLQLCVGRGISLTTAKQTLDLMHQNKKGSTSERSLAHAWKLYKPVVHFWAATLTLHQGFSQDFCVIADFPCHPTQIKIFLNLAEQYRRAGEKLKPARAQAPLLARADTWKVPKGISLELKETLKLVFAENYQPILNANKLKHGRYR